jgi:hypothetical protein
MPPNREDVDQEVGKTETSFEEHGDLLFSRSSCQSHVINSYVRNVVGNCTLVHRRYLKVQYRQNLLGHRVLRLRPHQPQRVLVIRACADADGAGKCGGERVASVATNRLAQWCRVEGVSGGDGTIATD